MSYQPVFKGPIEGFVMNQLKSDYWRVAATLSWLEAMQEAHVVFLRCCKRFPADEARDTPQAFMALFKTAWRNQFNDLSNYDSKHRVCVHMPVRDETGEEVEFLGVVDNDGMLAIMIEQAPSEVRMVLSVMVNAPAELLELAFKAWTSSGKRRAGSSKHLAAMLGLDPGVDAIRLVEDYFNGKPV
jgi:hypothetical protein